MEKHLMDVFERISSHISSGVDSIYLEIMKILGGKDNKGTDVQQFDDKQLPDELWFNILSKTPAKTLCVSGCVCKSWESICDELTTQIPTCGLLLTSLGSSSYVHDWYSYFSLTAKENFVIRKGLQSPQNKSSIYPSGFKSGLLRDLCFDFSEIQNPPHLCPTERMFYYFNIHGGLLHVVYMNGTAQVLNIATNTIYNVPKSRIVHEHGFFMHRRRDSRGLIIQLRLRCSGFMVVRFCPHLRYIEYYHSHTHRWQLYRLSWDSQYLSRRLRQIHLRLFNYVSILENGVVSLYVLTNHGFGRAIKFDGIITSPTNIWDFEFPLPQVVVAITNATIWECENSLHLTYYNATGLWIWKAVCTEVDSWEWISTLEINPTRRQYSKHSKPLHKLVLDDLILAKPLALHPQVAVLYLMIQSFVYSYNLNTKTLLKIGEIKDPEMSIIDHAIPFTPYLRTIKTGYWCGFEESIKIGGHQA